MTPSRKEQLRNLIPKTKEGKPKTDRLGKLDSLLWGYSFSDNELDFVEKEIKYSIEFLDKRRKLSTTKTNIVHKDEIPETKA